MKRVKFVRLCKLYESIISPNYYWYIYGRVYPNDYYFLIEFIKNNIKFNFK